MVGGITIKQSSGGNFFRLQQRACQTHSRTGHWCRLANPRKYWLFILSKSSLFPKQSTRSPLLRSQVGVSLMTLPLVIRCGWWGLISAPISAIQVVSAYSSFSEKRETFLSVVFTTSFASHNFFSSAETF